MDVESLAFLDRIASGIERQNELTEEAADAYAGERSKQWKTHHADLRKRDQDSAEARRVMRDKEQRDIEAHEARMVEHKLKVEEFELTATALGLRARVPDVIPEHMQKDAE